MLALDPRPDAVIVTGDIADGAFAEQYERAAELLAVLPMPVFTLPGNHDDADALDSQDGFTAGGLRVVTCNTAMPGEVTGRIDIEWLEAQIAVADADDRRHAPPAAALGHPGARRDRAAGVRPPGPRASCSRPIPTCCA